MTPDLSDRDYEVYFGEQGKGKTLLMKSMSLSEVELERDNRYCDINFDTSHSFSFKMTRKSWYKIQKILGLTKPVYKKIRKGRRYVWYELYH